MARVQIESWAWDLIVEHYAAVKDPSPDDRKVMQYILDKESRRIAHDTYMVDRRLESYGVTED